MVCPVNLKYFILKTVINCLDTSPPITKLVFLEMLPSDFMNFIRLISILCKQILFCKEQLALNLKMAIV